MKRLPVLSVVWKRRLRSEGIPEQHSDESKDQRSASVGEPAVDDARVNGETVLGHELGLITRLVGCSHREMGRPFADGKIKYRSCLKCGARRQFNSDTFETFGKFYVPPATTKNL